MYTEPDEAVKSWDNGRFSYLLYSEPDEAVKSWDNGRFLFGVVIVTIPNEETASKSMFYTEQDTGLIHHYQNTQILTHAFFATPGPAVITVCKYSRLILITDNIFTFRTFFFGDAVDNNPTQWWRNALRNIPCICKLFIYE